MARASMTKIISLVRDYIGDPAGADAQFTDDQIERSLDVHRWDLRNVPLKPLAAAPNTEYREWYSTEPYWEDDTTLTNGANSVLTPVKNGALHGRWSFAEGQSAVFAHGATYDPFGAAADLLEMWAGAVATEFDVDVDGASMRRSQKSSALRELAAQYRSQQRIVAMQQVRNDIY